MAKKKAPEVNPQDRTFVDGPIGMYNPDTWQPCAHEGKNADGTQDTGTPVTRESNHGVMAKTDLERADFAKAGFVDGAPKERKVGA